MSGYNVQPPTHGEYVVLLFVGQVLFMGVGLVGFGFCFFKPPEDPAQLELLCDTSTICFSIGLVIWLGRWVAKRIIG